MTEKAEALARWAQFVPPNAKPTPCPYCKHNYLRPCTEEEHGQCMNYKALQKRFVSRANPKTNN